MFESLLFILVVVALVIAASARKRLAGLEQSYEELARGVRDAREHLARLELRLKREKPAAAPAPAAAVPQAGTTPAAEPAPEEKVRPAPARPFEAPRPATRLPAEQAPAGAVAAASAADAGRSPAFAHAPAPRPMPPAPPSPPEEERPSFDWESLVGVQLFSWIAGIALALAAIFFLSYSIQRGWLQPPVRMAIGIVTGLGLLVLCEAKAARRYEVTANALDGAGIAILFSTFFASHALWNLIGGGWTFLFLVLVAVVAVLLSIRRDSLFIALLGLVGGFATPALLSTGEDRPFSLFGYLLLVNVGLAWVGYRKRWAILPVLSLIFTTLYQWSWVVKFLAGDRLPLAIGIFLVFPVAGFIALLAARPEGAAPDRDSPFGYAATVSATLPVLFAFYLATVAAYAEHTALLFGFLFVLDAGLLAIAVARGPELLHAAAAAATLAIFLLYFATAPQFAARPILLAFTALFLLFYLAAPVLARRLNHPFAQIGRLAVFVAPLLLFVLPASVVVDAPWASPGVIFGVLLLLLSAITVAAAGEGDGRLHALGALLAMTGGAAVSVSGLHANEARPSHLLTALGGYAAISLFYLAVPFIAERLERPFDRQHTAGLGVLALLAIPAFGLFAQTFQTLTSGFVLFALAGAAGWAVTPLVGRVLAAQDPNEPLPRALGGLGAWARSALPLAGLLFLFFFIVPVQARSVPPWPWLAVGGLILLAIGTAVLHTREWALNVSALVIAQLSLVLWLPFAGEAPGPQVALTATSVLAAFALGWTRLAARVHADATFDRAMDGSAIVTLLLAQIVAIVAGEQDGAPGLAVLVAAQVVFLVALLWVAARRGWHALALVALVPASIAVAFWQAGHAGADTWVWQIAFALAIFVVFLGYPLALGRRVGASILPHATAALASVMLFFVARAALLDADLAAVMGALPVAEAGLLAILLIQLLRIEPPGERALGRLALVAGSVLAFITVAIPLQLEKEWITIGWAAEAAALAWLYRRIPHRGLLYAAVGLGIAVFGRLAANPDVLAYYPRGSMRIWNWYLYTYLISAAALLFKGHLLATTDDRLGEELPRVSSLAFGGATILLFLLLNIEIADFFAEGPALTFNFSGTLAQDLSYTLGWALFAVGLLAVGIAETNRPARAAALGLLVVAILKAFLHDLGRLGGLYRVGSFVGLAICLALVAVALQKFVMARRPGEHR